MPKDGTYDLAQICLNGHIINSSAQTALLHNKDFCPKCGSPTITNCLNCQQPIDGDFYVRRGSNWVTGKMHLIKIRDFILPLFCPKCGVLFPWTEKKIEVSKEIVSECTDLNQEEKELFAKSINDIIKDTPETILSTNRIKKILAKLGKGVPEGLMDLIIDVASEPAKKILLSSPEN